MFDILIGRFRSSWNCVQYCSSIDEVRIFYIANRTMLSQKHVRDNYIWYCITVIAFHQY